MSSLKHCQWRRGNQISTFISFYPQFSWEAHFTDILNHYYLTHWSGFISLFAGRYVVLSLSQLTEIKFFLTLNLECHDFYWLI